MNLLNNKNETTALASGAKITDSSANGYHVVSVLMKIVSMIGYKRPLLLFGVLSLICFIIAGILGYLGLKPYYNGGRVYLTQAIGAGIFTIIGIQLFIAGLTLNALAKIVKGG